MRADEDGVRAHGEAVAAAENALVSAPVPTIAMVQGYCIGGGCGLALACDMRFADTTARLAITPAKLGIVYSLEATRRLVEEVGAAEAKRMLMSAEQLDAEDAHRIGLVNELKRPGELETYTYDYARLLASRAQNTVRAAKDFVDRIVAGQRYEDDDTRRMSAVADSPEYAEGLRAFLEGRPPDFP
ncbi:enoyl-CoA hydratase-related protein [Parasphingorhabdus pacifica]